MTEKGEGRREIGDRGDGRIETDFEGCEGMPQQGLAGAWPYSTVRLRQPGAACTVRNGRKGVNQSPGAQPRWVVGHWRCFHLSLSIRTTSQCQRTTHLQPVLQCGRPYAQLRCVHDTRRRSDSADTRFSGFRWLSRGLLERRLFTKGVSLLAAMQPEAGINHSLTGSDLPSTLCRSAKAKPPCFS
jgi:hypothetical protein